MRDEGMGKQSTATQHIGNSWDWNMGHLILEPLSLAPTSHLLSLLWTVP